MSLRGVQPFFAAVSSLGDGKLWYGIMVLMPMLAAERGLNATLHMLGVAAVTLPIYKFTKQLTRRKRPCNAGLDIQRGTHQLDEYSFPSGHTMHAVAFSVVIAAWFPAFLVPLFVITLLIALSRVVLGLHYPTDVVLGAILGFAIASVSITFVPGIQ